MIADPAKWAKINEEADSYLTKWFANRAEMKRQLYPPIYEIVGVVSGRMKKGRVRWEVSVRLRVSPGVGTGRFVSFFYPTKDRAIAKAVELQLRGILQSWEVKGA